MLLCASLIEVHPLWLEEVSWIQFLFPCNKHFIKRWIFPNNVTKSNTSMWIVQLRLLQMQTQFFRPMVLSYFCRSVKRKKKSITRKIILQLADKKDVRKNKYFPLFFSNSVFLVFAPFAAQQMRNSAGTTKVIFPLKRCRYILFRCSIVCFPPPHIADCTHCSVNGHCWAPPLRPPRDTTMLKCANNTKTSAAAQD